MWIQLICKGGNNLYTLISFLLGLLIGEIIFFLWTTDYSDPYNSYSNLFTRMGIIDSSNNEWIETVEPRFEILDTPFYYSTIRLSDSLTLNRFIQRADDIAEKLNLNHLYITRTRDNSCMLLIFSYLD